MNRRQLFSRAIPTVGALALLRSQPAAAAVGSGTYEETDSVVAYTGSWTNWANSANSGGSAKFCNAPDASVGLMFSGSSLTVVFLRQSNAGIANVLIDGTQVDSLDCYAPTQMFQQQKTYSVTPGTHTVSVVVSGNRNAASADNYLLIDAFIVAGPALPVTGGKRIQTTLDLVGQNPRATLAFAGNAGGAYAFGGDALSASTRLVWFSQGLAPIVYARWILVWNPRNSMTGVRLVQADSGPSNIVEIARVESSPSATPIPTGTEVTLQLNNLVSGGMLKFLGHQEKGNGSEGPIIFSSALEIVWDLS